MFRRRFLQMLTLASATPLKSFAAAPTRTATLRVTGFTCITCATGLDTLISRHKGIKSSSSTYPEGMVKVVFNPDQVTEQWIEGFIANLGFKARLLTQK